MRDSATEIFQSLPVMQKFAKLYDVKGFEGRPKMLDVLLDCYAEFLGRKPDEKPPSIAIVDLKDLPTQKEFELFKDYFESRRLHVALSAHRTNSNSTVANFITKATRSTSFTNGCWSTSTCRSWTRARRLLDAYRAGAVCMVNSFRGKLVHKKAIFAVLTNEKYSHLFDDDELTAIARPRSLDPQIPRRETRSSAASEIDLVEWTRANCSETRAQAQRRLRRSRHLHRLELSRAEWDAAISRGSRERRLSCSGTCEDCEGNFPDALRPTKARWDMVEQLVDLDPLLLTARSARLYAALVERTR